MTGRPIPQANAKAIARASATDLLELSSILEEFFFIGKDGFYHNKRMDEELKKERDVSEKRRKAGKTGGKATQANARAIGQAKEGQLPLHSQTQSLSKDKEGSAEENLRYGLGSRRPKLQNVKAMTEATTAEEFLKASGLGQ